MYAKGIKSLRGVNYASGAAGIRSETGQAKVFNLILNFKL